VLARAKYVVGQKPKWLRMRITELSSYLRVCGRASTVAYSLAFPFFSSS
jgi:hypothetical protein